MNTLRTASGTELSTRLSTRVSALALAGLLTLSTLLGVNTLASVDGAPAQVAQAAQPRA